jgi:hypothetical protein
MRADGRARRKGRRAGLIVLAATALAACGGLGGPAGGTSPLRTVTGGPARAAHRSRPKRHYPSFPVVNGLGTLGPRWHPVVTVRGQTAAWIAQRDGVTMLRFDQRLVRLVLHAGSADPGSGPWQYGDTIRGSERRRLAAAFNAGFKLDTGAGGWQSGGHVAVPLTAGRASIVTYRDGTTDIGAWQHGIPTSQPIASVRQNLSLLVDNGVAAATVNSCIETCWGATIGNAATVARSALGIDANRRLIYAATPSATPATLAQGLIDGGAQRAAELDINPDWVAAYLYHHGRGLPEFLPVIPGQYGVAGHFLAPYTRDFFAIVER